MTTHVILVDLCCVLGKQDLIVNFTDCQWIKWTGKRWNWVLEPQKLSETVPGHLLLFCGLYAEQVEASSVIVSYALQNFLVKS